MIEEVSESGQEMSPRLEFQDVHEALIRLKTEIGKYIVGQERMIELLLAALLSRGHVLIEGYPGLAKTLTAKLVARTIESDFVRVQFTPDLMPSDLLGTSIFNFKTSEFEFKRGPLFSNLVVIDEINRAPAKTQSALFEVMEERQITMDGVRHALEEPFLIVATQNPIDLEGTYQLPEAQMDRFIFRIKVDYPSLEEETAILHKFEKVADVHELQEVSAVISSEELIAFQKRLVQVHIEDSLLAFIARLVHQTRSGVPPSISYSAVIRIR